MPGLIAEMRHINDGSRIIGQDLQNRTGGQGLQPLARFQDGQGAQEANGIQGIGNITHVPQI